MRASRTRARVRRTRRGPMRPVAGVWCRRTTLLAAGAVALMAGICAGFVSGLVTGADGPTAPEAATGPADECAVVQGAWSRSATLQLGMSAEDPATLRRGFVGARDALAEASPPDAIADDWLVVRTYVGTVADEVEGADEGEVASAVAAALAGLDTEAMTAASNRVTTFLKDGCSGAGDATDEPAG